MGALFSGSIASRLWLALSVLATGFTLLGFGLYSWLTIDDEIADAHTATGGKLEAVLTSISNFGIDRQAPTDREMSAAESLGIEFVEILDDNGQVVGGLGFGNQPIVNEPLGPEDLPAPGSGFVYQTIRFAGDNHVVPASLSPVTVVRGGRFGEDHVIPLTTLGMDQPGYVRVTLSYPDLTGQARALLVRGSIVALLIIAATSAAMWPFLQHFVARPLRRYSHMALQIAAGRAYVRMHLQATARGVDVHPLSQALQEFGAMKGPYDAIHRAVGLEPGVTVLQMLSRVGYAKVPASPSPRRDLDTIVRT